MIEQEEPSLRKIKIFQNFLKSMRFDSGEFYEEMKKKSDDHSDKMIGRVVSIPNWN